MNPISTVLKLWFVLKNIPWLWKLVNHWQEVKVVGEKALELYNSSKLSGGLPTCTSFEAFIISIETVLRSNVVDIPDVDEVQLAEELRQMRALMSCSIENERNKRGLSNVR